MIVLIVLLILGFTLSMIGAVRTKKSRHYYRKLANSEALEGHFDTTNQTSYQKTIP